MSRVGSALLSLQEGADADESAIFHRHPVHVRSLSRLGPKPLPLTKRDRRPLVRTRYVGIRLVYQLVDTVEHFLPVSAQFLQPGDPDALTL